MCTNLRAKIYVIYFPGNYILTSLGNW